MNTKPPGKKADGGKEPLKPDHFHMILAKLKEDKTFRGIRNVALVLTHLHSALRSVDLLALTWGDISSFDVLDDQSFHVLSDIEVIQQKTKTPVTFHLPAMVGSALFHWWKMAKAVRELSYDTPLFLSDRMGPDGPRPLSYSRYVALLKGWIADIGLDPSEYGTHSIRKALPSEYYRLTRDPVATMQMLGHRSIQSTVPYIKTTFVSDKSVRDSFQEDADPQSGFSGGTNKVSVSQELDQLHDEILIRELRRKSSDLRQSIAFAMNSLAIARERKQTTDIEILEIEIQTLREEGSTVEAEIQRLTLRIDHHQGELFQVERIILVPNPNYNDSTFKLPDGSNPPVFEVPFKVYLASLEAFNTTGSHILTPDAWEQPCPASHRLPRLPPPSARKPKKATRSSKKKSVRG